MSNFETGITYSPTGNNDISDRAREVSNWNTETAVSEAKRHGLDISDEHFDVIHFLRDYYVEHGWPKSVHKLSRLLDNQFRHIGGKRHLHKLFPQGPLNQGAQLAGLPMLYNTVDKSFGTAH
jgi:tRNA 2-thiouridine synthesizing protein E